MNRPAIALLLRLRLTAMRCGGDSGFGRRRLQWALGVRAFAVCCFIVSSVTIALGASAAELNPETLSVRALAIDANGSLWVGAVGDGLARRDKDGHWKQFTKASTDGGLPDDAPVALAFDRDGALWIGSLVGPLTRLDRDGHWQSFTKASTGGGLPDGIDYVATLAPAGDRALWVGTLAGLARFEESRSWFRGQDTWQVHSKSSTNQGLPDDKVRALATAADGSLWVGTDAGLARFDKSGHWQTFTMASTAGGLPSDKISALANAVDGSLWIGTAAGLARLDKSGQWQIFTVASTNRRLPDDKITALANAADGSLWVGTDAGLASLARP